jgi:23S rRNA pseudouridine2605 synthase
MTPRRREAIPPSSPRTQTGPESERLQKALARAGLGSRRVCEDLIRAGRVTVNGRVATLGDRVRSTDRVEVDGTIVPLHSDLRYYLLNKPAGVVTTARDPQRRRDVSAFYPPGPRVFPVGRLDRETEGLLLLTNDGELANRLTHPRYGAEREYLAEVEGSASDRVIARLMRGVELEDGLARARSASRVAVARGRHAVSVVMAEGRKREVRRMLAAVGLTVRRLVRVRIGPVQLGRLKPGDVRSLTPSEVRALYRHVDEASR